jgi:hypothetical protein
LDGGSRSFLARRHPGGSRRRQDRAQRRPRGLVRVSRRPAVHARPQGRGGFQSGRNLRHTTRRRQSHGGPWRFHPSRFRPSNQGYDGVEGRDRKAEQPTPRAPFTRVEAHAGCDVLSRPDLPSGVGGVRANVSVRGMDAATSACPAPFVGSRRAAASCRPGHVPLVCVPGIRRHLSRWRHSSRALDRTRNGGRSSIAGDGHRPLLGRSSSAASSHLVKPPTSRRVFRATHRPRRSGSAGPGCRRQRHAEGRRG